MPGEHDPFFDKDYLEQIKQERSNAEKAIMIVKQILSGGVPESSHLFKRKEVSEYLGISMDSLRNWEMNGLLTVKRKQNGYRVYTDADIQRLIIIRSLKCANYSSEAILQMLRQLSENPDTDIAVILNRPIGNCRPNHKNICYPINYGYIQGVVAPDGEEQNAYILGVNYSLKEFTGRIIAIVQRFDDVEEKWVVAPKNVVFSKDEIVRQVDFQKKTL